MVERRDLVEVGEDLGAQRALGLLVGLEVRVEAQLEVAHELRRDRGVGHQHVVLVALGEARADPLAVLAVGAQDRDLAAVQPGRDHEPVEIVGLRVAAVHRREQLGDAVAERVEVERPVRAEHAELLHPRLVLADQPRRDLLDHAQPEVLEHRQRVAQLDLRPALVERDARVPLQGLQRDHERAVLGELLEQRDVHRAGVRRRVALVVLGQVRRPDRPQQPCPRGAEALDERVAQRVVPGARELDDLALELRVVDVAQPVRRVDEEVHAHPRALAEHVLGLDVARSEAAHEQLAHAIDEHRPVAVAREREDERGAAAVRRAAAEQAHAVGALEREQRDDRAAQVVDRRREQLVLREGVEQRDRALVVVRALDQVLGLEHAPQLAVQDRRLGRRLGVGLGREQAEQARLAGDLAVGRDAPHADVVHPLVAVHRRARVGLVDDQQLARRGERAQRLRELLERDGRGVGGALLVGEDAEAGAGDAAVRVVLDLVLARAEQDEVAAQQPGQEVDRLADLVGVVARARLAREPDHRLDALGHRAEVVDRVADREQHGLHVGGQLLELAVGQLAREVEVHHRLAMDRVAGVRDARDPPVRRARCR